MKITEDDKKILESLGWHLEGYEGWYKYSAGGPCHGMAIGKEGDEVWHEDIANHLEHLRFAKRTYK
jgi:hypothetical protein